MARSGGKSCERHIPNSTASGNSGVMLQKVLEGSSPQINLKNNRAEACVLPHGTREAAHFTPQVYYAHKPGQSIKWNKAGDVQTFIFGSRSLSPACS